jgi:hypothetical protein
MAIRHSRAKNFAFLGYPVLNHLTANGAGFSGSQVAVVAVGQVHAHFLGSLHLETIHSLTGLGDIQLVVVRVAHIRSLLCFLRKKTLSEESIFCSVTIV